jgi:predicted permease
MLSIANSIAPLIFIILAGVIGGRAGVLPDTMRKGLSDFCYYFGMPALLIRTIASAPPSTTEPHLIWSGYLIPIALVWLAGSLLARQREGATIAMASAYGNVIMLGIPLSLMQFGPAAATTVALIVLVHSPVLFLAAAAHSELVKGRARSQASGIGAAALASGGGPSLCMLFYGFCQTLREVCIDLVTNPIILAILVGLVLRLTGTGLPPIADAAFALLGQGTLPCVLLAIGLGLSTFKIKGKIGIASLISLLKLVVMPVTAWLVATHVLALPPLEVGVITLLSAMPTGANAYIFANRQETAGASVSAAVALSTIVSALTIALVLALLGKGI